MYLREELYTIPHDLSNNDDTHLFKYLLTRMPRECLYSQSKDELKFRNKTKNYHAIKKAKFLNYNQNVVSEIVFDVDNITHSNLFTHLDNVAQTFYNKFQIPVNWVCATNKGVQFCITLNIPIRTKKQKQIVSDFKEYIIDNWNLIDPNGSKRLKGWWRNPLNHRHVFYNNYVTFNDILEFVKSNCISKQKQFKAHINIQKVKQAKTQNKTYFTIGEFKNGNRNNFVWYNTMLSTNSTNYDTILSITLKLNKNDELDINELENIAKSVLKYNQDGKNYIYNNSKKSSWEIGKMKLETIKNLSEEEYKKEVKRRQSLAGKLIGANNIKKLNATKQAETQKKIMRAIQQLQKDNKKITGVAIQELANVNKRTALKYLKQLKENNLV